MTETIIDRDQLLFEQVAKTIGGEVTSARVERLINGMKKGGHYVHGIKDTRFKQQIMENGVLPLTPEGGASYWTIGKSVFGELRGSEELQAYDTTFFHYAHARSERPDRSTMLIAITNRDLLGKHGIQVNGDYAQVKRAVPRDSIALLEVNLPLAEQGSRASSQKTEQAMFSLLEKAVNDGYKGGEIIVAGEEAVV